MTNVSSHSEDTLYLIGFYLDPDAERPDVYTLFVIGVEDRPLVSGEYIVFFSDPELVFQAIKLCDNDIKNLRPLPKDTGLDCYVAESLYLITAEDVDSSAIVLNFLNVLFDLVKATQLPMPSEYKRVLYAFANHLTFDREMAPFFANQGISRSMIIDAILWCIGAVVSKSKLLNRAV